MTELERTRVRLLAVRTRRAIDAYTADNARNVLHHAIALDVLHTGRHHGTLLHNELNDLHDTLSRRRLNQDLWQVLDGLDLEHYPQRGPGIFM